MPGIFEKAGFSDKERLILFLTICIPVRSLLAHSAHKYHENTIYTIVLASLSLLSVFTNINSFIKKGRDDVIWSRLFHAFTSMMVVIAFISGHGKFVYYILLFDLIIGIIQYLKYNKVFNPIKIL